MRPFDLGLGLAERAVALNPDHRNTPRFIADQTGNAVGRNDNTETFGNSVPNGDPNNTGSAFDFPLRLPGQYAGRETNLTYNSYNNDVRSATIPAIRFLRRETMFDFVSKHKRLLQFVLALMIVPPFAFWG